MAKQDGVIVFDDVSFEYTHTKPILIGASFVLRRGAKLALMGQNGAGKSTIFDLILGNHLPHEGNINKIPRTTIALSRQTIPREQFSFPVRKFFEGCFSEKKYDIDPLIDDVLETVDLKAPLTREIGSFSGGQQARLLLASALIQQPDILLLDEPTNNLDQKGIDRLTEFIKSYKKSVVVISHDAHFLNSFVNGVLYLDVHTHQIEQYDGNYHDAVKEITLRIEKENRKNAQYAKEIQANKEKANFFAMKGGQMRLVAKKMREKAEEYEENKIAIRKEDRTIRPFVIDIPSDLPPTLLTISSFNVRHNESTITCECNITLKKNFHLQIVGPNGIGKSTLLEDIALRHAEGECVASGVKIGYYRQDFSTLDFELTVFEQLMNSMERPMEEDMRSIASGFLLGSDVMRTKIGSLSEGQKGLVAFASLVLMKPGILILDEPTNHINFRHLPIIASALNEYRGGMILVSHVSDFVAQIRIDTVLDLKKSLEFKRKKKI